MASTIFSGSSRYANDFSQVIERSVSLASLPITQLVSQRTKLSDQSSALSDLASSVASLRSSLSSIGDAKTAIKVSSSDGAIVAASADLSASPGAFQIQVVSTGSRATAITKDDLPVVSDYLQQNISPSTTFRLTVGGSSFTLTPQGNTLASLVESINADSSHGVQAVVVNMGSTVSPNYRLSLQSVGLGPTALQLEALDGGDQPLLDASSAGTFAEYRINGQPAGDTLKTDSNTHISVSPGLSVDLLKEGASEVVISPDKDRLSSALAGLATSYNKVMSEIDKSRGESGGALKANSVLSAIGQSLRKLTGFTSTGTVKSLEQLGFSFSDSGTLSFDTAKLTALELGQVSEFLGSADAGGLLKSADEILTTIDQGSTGLLPSSMQSIKDQIAETDRQVAANEERIELLKQRLASQMAEADALIGLLEQQVSYMNGLFEAMRVNAQS